MIMRPPTRPSTTTLSHLSVHRCVESDSERASDLTHEASSHATPRHATCCRHSRTSESGGLRVAESDRTPHTPRSATCCSVALGSAGACDPCNARVAHAVHACAANRYPSKQESHPEPPQPPPDCGGAWCPLGVLASAAFFCGVRGRLLALHPPKRSTSEPPAPRHVHETTTRHGETARDRELGVGVSARADPSDRAARAAAATAAAEAASTTPPGAASARALDCGGGSGSGGGGGSGGGKGTAAVGGGAAAVAVAAARVAECVAVLATAAVAATCGWWRHGGSSARRLPLLVIPRGAGAGRSLCVVRSRTRQHFLKLNIFFLNKKIISFKTKTIPAGKKSKPRGFSPGWGACVSPGPGFGVWPLAFHAAAFFRLRRQPAPPRAIAPEAPLGVRC